MAPQQKSRNASFAEVVFEGKPKVVRAFLHGLMLGSGREGAIFFSYVEGIDHGGKAPRFAERFGLPGTDVMLHEIEQEADGTWTIPMLESLSSIGLGVLSAL